MTTTTLKNHADYALKAESIELPESYYDYEKDIRYNFNSDIIKQMAGTNTNTTMSQKNPGWDGDSDNDF